MKGLGHTNTCFHFPPNSPPQAHTPVFILGGWWLNTQQHSFTFMSPVLVLWETVHTFLQSLERHLKENACAVGSWQENLRSGLCKYYEPQSSVPSTCSQVTPESPGLVVFCSDICISLPLGAAPFGPPENQGHLHSSCSLHAQGQVMPSREGSLGCSLSGENLRSLVGTLSNLKEC